MNYFDYLAPRNFEGAGSQTTGGNKEGKICIVTDLRDYIKITKADVIENTLRYFLEEIDLDKKGMTIVFAKSGVINLKERLNITKDNTTIDGSVIFDNENGIPPSNKPQKGITIANCPLVIRASNVVVRYLRCRLGNAYVYYGERSNEFSLYSVTSESKKEGKGQTTSGFYHNADALGIGNKQSAMIQNIVLDHVSLSWAIDENLGLSNATNVTLQYCIFAQGLSDAGHPIGNTVGHSKGSLLELDEDENTCTVHHCFFAHNSDRNPKINKGFYDIRYNVMYNYGKNFAALTNKASRETKANFVNNHFIPGKDTDAPFTTIQVADETARLYLSENFLYDKNGIKPNANSNDWKDIDSGSLDNKAIDKVKKSNPFSNFDTIKEDAASDNFVKKLLKTVGCYYENQNLQRDAFDAIFVEREGKIINTPFEAGLNFDFSFFIEQKQSGCRLATDSPQSVTANRETNEYAKTEKWNLIAAEKEGVFYIQSNHNKGYLNVEDNKKITLTPNDKGAKWQITQASKIKYDSIYDRTEYDEVDAYDGYFTLQHKVSELFLTKDFNSNNSTLKVEKTVDTTKNPFLEEGYLHRWRFIICNSEKEN